MVAKTLKTADAARLAECERVIKDGIGTFMAVGEALTEIRDSKLYRGTHRSFETYCLDKWRMGRARAYQLIDHAMTIAKIDDAAGGMSTTVDISERETRAIKADLPTVVDDIKARVADGEKPEDAAKNAIEAKRKTITLAQREEQKRQREVEQTEHEQSRQTMRNALPDDVKKLEAAKDARRVTNPQLIDAEVLHEFTGADRIAELEEANAALEADIAALRAENEIYRDMKVQFEKGGYDEIVSGLKYQIGVLNRQIETFTDDRAAYKRGMDMWRKRAEALGYSNEEVIDLREGAHG